MMKKENTNSIGLGNWKVPGFESEFLHYFHLFFGVSVELLCLIRSSKSCELLSE